MQDIREESLNEVKSEQSPRVVLGNRPDGTGR